MNLNFSKDKGRFTEIQFYDENQVDDKIANGLGSSNVFLQALSANTALSEFLDNFLNLKKGAILCNLKLQIRIFLKNGKLLPRLMSNVMCIKTQV